MPSRSAVIAVPQVLRDQLGEFAEQSGQDEASVAARALAEGLTVLRLRRSARDIAVAARASAALDEGEALRLAAEETRAERRERHRR